MQLNYKVLGEGYPLIIMHGLMGSLDNWQTLARQFSAHFKVYIVDARNHGKSPHSDDMSYPLMADDLLEFMEQQGIKKAHLIGHSMGGKTVMEFTVQHPEKVVRLVVADIAPKTYPPHHDDIFKALFAIDLLKITNRADAEAAMEKEMPDASMRQFLLKSLDRTEDWNYVWKMNLQVLYDQYEKIIKGISPGGPVDTPTLVLRGGNSRYIHLDDIKLFHQYFNDVQMVTIENVGHWLHAEAPKEFFEAVMRFLEEE